MFNRIKIAITSFKNFLLRKINATRTPPRSQDHWLIRGLNDKSSYVAIKLINMSRMVLQNQHPKKEWYDDEIPSIFFIINDFITRDLKYNVIITKQQEHEYLLVRYKIYNYKNVLVAKGTSIDSPEYSYSVAALRAYRELISHRNIYGR